MSRTSGRILKADALRGLGSNIVFDFEDVQERCEDFVRDAGERAAASVAEAERQADGIRTRAHDEGRTAGRAEGLADAAAEIERRAEERARELVEERVRTLVPAIAAVAGELRIERDRWLVHWEQQGVGLAVAIAERVLHAEIPNQPDAVRETLGEVLRMTTGVERIRVHLHPGDVDRLGAGASDVVGAIAGCAEAEVVADAEIAPGGCLVETSHGTIDARVESQLDRIAAELGAERTK